MNQPCVALGKDKVPDSYPLLFPLGVEAETRTQTTAITVSMSCTHSF